MRIGRLFWPLYRLFYNKYWLDELYINIIVKKIILKGLFAGLKLFDTLIIDGLVNGIVRVAMTKIFAGFRSFDTLVIDGLVNGIAVAVSTLGRVLRKVQTGQLQLYGMFIILGILAIGLCLVFSG